MKTLLNYVGQLRIYSLVDLIILLVAIKISILESIGIICLHVGFLAYLESNHDHYGRKIIPAWIWVFFIIIGTFFYFHLEVIFFLVCSYLYTRKNHGNWAMYSPLFRGLQVSFLISGVIGYTRLSLIVFLVMFIRNTIGDCRDVEKDYRENMKTTPIIIGLRKNFKHGHLLAIVMSSLIWWQYTNISLSILFLCIFVEIITYNLTPR